MDITALKGLVQPAPEELFFRKNDPNDPRLGEFVTVNPEDYDSASLVILGCLQDEGVRKNNGRVGAAKAPGKIRELFYRLVNPSHWKAGLIYDLGDIPFSFSLEETHQIHCDVVTQLLKDGKQVIVLGGGNDLSYPDGKAMSQIYPGFTAMNIDAHLDIRIAKERNSGTPYRQLIEESLLEGKNFYELGIQPQVNSPVYLEHLKAWGGHLHTLQQFHDAGAAQYYRDILEEMHAEALFVGFDMDSVKAADAPGVSASSPTGFSAEEACSFADIAGQDPRVRLFEITEVNPETDVDQRTSRLAAFMMHAFIDATQKA